MALCHFFPAYKVEDFRAMPLRTVHEFIAVMEQLTKG